MNRTEIVILILLNLNYSLAVIVLRFYLFPAVELFINFAVFLSLFHSSILVSVKLHLFITNLLVNLAILILLGAAIRLQISCAF